jgi:hypothetical protein
MHIRIDSNGDQKVDRYGTQEAYDATIGKKRGYCVECRDITLIDENGCCVGCGEENIEYNEED